MPRTPNWIRRRREIQQTKQVRMKDSEVHMLCEKFIDKSLLDGYDMVDTKPLKKRVRVEEWNWFLVRVIQIYQELGWQVTAMEKPTFFGKTVLLHFVEK